MSDYINIDSVSDLLRFIDEHREQILDWPHGPTVVPGVARLRNAVWVEDGFVSIYDSVLRRLRIRDIPAHPAVMYFRRGERVRFALWSLDMDALDAVEKAGVTGDFARAAVVLGAGASDELLALWETGIPESYLIAALQVGFGVGNVDTVVEAWRNGIPVEFLSAMGGAA